MKIISGNVIICALKVSKNKLITELSFSGFSKKYFCKSGEKIKTPKNEAKESCQPKLSQFEGSKINVIAATNVNKK